MNEHFIKGVPRYFEPHVNDCFTTALSSYILYKKLNPHIVMADYLSFMYNEESGYIGLNYLFKPYTSIIFTEEQLNTAFHFIYTRATENYKTFQEKNLPIKDKKKINILRFMDEDAEKAYMRTKELLDNNVPVIAAVDLFYMSYHQAYQKEHGLHYIVITGYDEERGYYELFDKYALATCNFDGNLPISDVKTARASNNPQKDALIGEYERKILNNWVEVIIDDDFKITKDDIESIISESLNRMKGHKTVLGNKCGIHMLKNLKNDIEERKTRDFDDKNIYYFKNYLNQAFKVIGRNRKRFKAFINDASQFLNIEVIPELETCLEESSKFWDISANLSYKFAICKREAIIDDISLHLDKIIEKENIIIEKLEDLLVKTK